VDFEYIDNPPSTFDNRFFNKLMVQRCLQDTEYLKVDKYFGDKLIISTHNFPDGFTGILVSNKDSKIGYYAKLVLRNFKNYAFSNKKK
jgi:hypothetical protein